MFYPKVSEKYGDLLRIDVAAAFPRPELGTKAYAAENTDVFIKCLEDLENKYYDSLEIDFYCVMPNHVHIIFSFQDRVTKKGAIGSRSYSLGDIVRVLKATTSRDIGISVWQPNFYEHIIRNEKSLDRIRRYIVYNTLIEYEDIPWKLIDPAI